MASTLSVSSSIIALTALTMTYPFLASAVTLEGTFFIYAAVSFVMAAVALVFLPETRGRTAAEVIRQFEK